MKKIFLTLIILGIIMIFALFGWTQYKLTQSRNDMVPSRAVTNNSEITTQSSQLSEFNETTKPLENFDPEILVAYEKERKIMENNQEELEQAMKEQPIEEILLASGSFVKVDAIHHASGTIQIIEKGENVFIEFPEDFQAANGPDLYVLLSQNQELNNSIDQNKTINLGPLVSKKGSQIYSISKKEWNQNNYAVTIWCRAFDVHFSHALLEKI